VGNGYPHDGKDKEEDATASGQGWAREEKEHTAASKTSGVGTRGWRRLTTSHLRWRHILEKITLSYFSSRKESHLHASLISPVKKNPFGGWRRKPKPAKKPEWRKG